MNAFVGYRCQRKRFPYFVGAGLQTVDFPTPNKLPTVLYSAEEARQYKVIATCFWTSTTSLTAWSLGAHEPFRWLSMPKKEISILCGSGFGHWTGSWKKDMEKRTFYGLVWPYCSWDIWRWPDIFQLVSSRKLNIHLTDLHIWLCILYELYCKPSTFLLQINCLSFCILLKKQANTKI
jgi:hypothetical protein